jgi:predicted Zn-dependent protease
VLLVNLLAAGGIGFPGVAGSVWLLMAVGLNLTARRGFAWSAPRRVGWALLAVVVSLLVACFQTAYLPILNGRVWQDRGEVLVYASRELTDPVEVQQALLAALRAFEEAAEADRFAAEPRMNAAQIYHQLALRLPDDAAKAAAAEHFARMAQETLDRDRRSQARVAAVGYMDFESYDATDNHRHLTRSRDRFQRAVELFPSNSFARARLAWTHHLAGDDIAAAEEAAEALRLDALTPHEERKLGQRGIFDDLAAPRQLAQLRRVLAGQSAEQLMKRLRNKSDEGLP